MGLFRLLFLIAIIAGAFWLWRRFSRTTATRANTRNSATQAAPMVRCQHCGVHVPRNNALANGEQWFCSQNHLEQGRRSDEH